MIYAYGSTLQGTYHIKNDIVCQDAHYISKCSDNFCIAAVADGLGSEIHSDVASKIAVRLAVDYCAATIQTDMLDQQIEATICTSFHRALSAIEEEARKNLHELDQYDTTLSLAVFIGDRLIYGHSGDSGIIVLTDEGLYEKVTEQQRDSDNCVFPLCFGEEKWVFGTFEKKVASVFLATDGIYETLFPLYVRDEPVNIHVSLARYFMDNRVISIDEIGEEEVSRRNEKFLLNIPDSLVNDDKTIVVMINTAVESHLQPPEYYQEPDWNELKRKRDEEYRLKAYPHLKKYKYNVTKTENKETIAEDEGNNSQLRTEAISSQKDIQNVIGRENTDDE